MRLAALYTPTHRRRRTKKGGEHRRGGALIMVFLFTTVLAALAADLQNTTQVNLQLAANARDRLQAHFHARSAVQLEVFFLRYAQALKSTLGKFLPIPLVDLSSYFVSSDTMKGMLKREGPSPEDREIKEGFASDKPFGDFQGSFWVDEVVDENRKINLGAESGFGCVNPIHIMLYALINEKRFDPLFETIGDTRDPEQNRLQIIANITDYRDRNTSVDTVCTFTGQDPRTAAGVGEDNKYQRLPYGAKYKPKNGPLWSLMELRLVPGVNDAFLQLFASHFTIWTDSPKIYLTEADDQMLLAATRALMNRPLLPGDEEKFGKFLEDRGKLRLIPGMQLDQKMFESLIAQAGIPIDDNRKKELFEGPNAVLTFSEPTPVYRIKAVGRVGDTTSTMTVVWRATPNVATDVKYWRED